MVVHAHFFVYLESGLDENMLPGLPRFPGEDFINSFYPLLFALVLGLIIGFRFVFWQSPFSRVDAIVSSVQELHGWNYSLNSTQLAARRWLKRGKKLSASLCISRFLKQQSVVFLNDSTVLQFINATGKLCHSSITLIEKKYFQISK